MKKDHQHIVILMGPPGSGKGTQATRLCKELEIPHVSTGDLFRAHMKQGSPLGEKAKQYIEKGQYVPDDLVLDMLFDRVSNDDCKKGFLLDGFPRTIAQAQALSERLSPDSTTRVLFLKVDEEEVIKRLSGRRTCSNCGEIYHISEKPTKIEGACDRCQGELFQRADDKEDVISERLKVYHNQTSPVIDYYSSEGLVQVIDGSLPVDQVYTSLLESINQLG